MTTHIRRHALTSRVLAVVLGASVLDGAPSAAQAQATLITFGGNACTGAGNVGAGTNTYFGVFDVQGFRFSGAPVDVFSTPCDGNATYAGTTTLYADNVGSVTTLTQLSGNPFSIVSIDLAPLLLFGQDQLVTFTGALQGGGTVSQSFTIPGQSTGMPALTTFTFLPTFANLSSVEFSANVQPYYQFTNVSLDSGAITATPEPGTWLLLGSGLVALGAAARRRRA